MQAGMVSIEARTDHVKVNLDVGSQDFGRNENRASMADKFDTDSLSLHVFSIP